MANKKVLFSVASTAIVASAFVASEDVSAATEHKVNSGDTLWKVAQANNVQVSDLRKWNNLQSDLIFPNQVLQLKSSSNKSSSSKDSSKSQSSNSSGSTYTVKSGDSLSAIARENNVSVKKLMSWNDLDSTLIFPGNKLSLKNGGSSSSSSKPAKSESSSSKSTYTVKAGDTLSKIASSHGTSAKKVADLNNMSLSDIIHVGDKLKVSGKASSSSKNSSTSSNSGSSSSSKTSSYVVKSGDTLSKIARAHGTTANKIASLSGISTSSIIHIGDKLTVSGKASSGSSSSSSSNTNVSNDSKPSGSNGFSANDLINSANSVMGTKYVWGGTTQSGGFDCSGFIHWAYNDAGKEMPRTSTDGYYDRSYHINKSELQVGDLVFFSGTYRPGISHMGIYAGNNEFKHAATSTGVTTTSLDNPYWSKHFDSYKRFY